MIAGKILLESLLLSVVICPKTGRGSGLWLSHQLILVVLAGDLAACRVDDDLLLVVVQRPVELLVSVQLLHVITLGDVTRAPGVPGGPTSNLLSLT